MDLTRSSTAATLRAFCAAHPSWVLFDEGGEAVREVASGKILPLALGQVRFLEERRNARNGQPYLVVGLDDGRELALSEMGVAFAPLRPNVPQAPEMPPVVCLRDFRTLHDRLEHQLFGHPDDPVPRDALDLVALAIAVLDGARAVGFDIGDEERALERLLAEIELRRAGK